MDGLDLKPDVPKLDDSVDWQPAILHGGLQQNERLEGNAGQVDPDANSRELLIEWDRWWNKLAFQLKHNLNKHMSSWEAKEINWNTRRIESKFPFGVHAGVDFVISADRKVLKANIVHSSGYPEYDALVVRSVQELGRGRQAKVLKFPEHSRRLSVEQVLEFEKIDSIYKQQPLKFGDTERVQLDD